MKVKRICLLILVNISITGPSLAWSETKCETVLKAAAADPPSPPTIANRIRLSLRHLKELIAESFESQQKNLKDRPSLTSSKHDRKYRAHNKDTERNNQNGQLYVAARVNGMPGISYFVKTIYQTINPRTGYVGVKPVMRPQELAQNVIAEADIHYHQVPTYELVSGSAPLIPDGYELVNTSDFMVNEYGNFEYQGSAATKLSAKLAKVRNRALNRYEMNAYTELDEPVPFEHLPAWLKEEITLLQGQHRQGVSDIEIAQLLVRLIRQKLEYRVDKDSQAGVLPWLYSGKCQCDGAALITVSILRQFFKMPSRFVGGYIGAMDTEYPDDSVVVVPTAGHAWVQVYDQATGFWIGLDPTPSTPDREKKETSQDGRYKVNSPQQNESPDGKAQNEKTGEDDIQQKIKPRKWSEPSGAEFKRQRSVKEQLGDLFEQSLSPIQLSQALFRFRGRVTTDAPMSAKLSDLSTALNSLPFDSWSAATDALFKDFDPEDENPKVAKRLRDLEMVARIASESSFAHSMMRCDQFRTMATALRRVLPVMSAQKTDDLTIARKIVKSVSDRPLELRWLFSEYPKLTESVESAQKFIRDLSSGNLSSFTLRSQVNRYLDLDLLLTPKQREEYVNWGRPEPYAEGAMVLRDVRDYENPERIYRDGQPPSLDYYRAISGDLMETLYNGESKTNQPAHLPDYRVSTILVPDMSLSNEEDNRGLIRDAILLRYLEGIYHQFGHGTHGSQVILLPYADSPQKDPLIIKSPDGLYDEFSKWAAEFRSNKGGNDTARALVEALNLAESQMDSYSRVNVVLITDGQETIKERDIIEVQRRLNPSLEVNLVAVTLVTGNQVIDNLIESFFGQLKNPTQGPRRHHATREEIKKMVESAVSGDKGRELVSAQSYDWRGWRYGREAEISVQRAAKRLDLGQ